MSFALQLRKKARKNLSQGSRRVPVGTCFEHPSVHLQEDLYMQFYGISLMHLYQAHAAIDQTAYMDA